MKYIGLNKASRALLLPEIQCETTTKCKVSVRYHIASKNVVGFNYSSKPWLGKLKDIDLNYF